MVGLLMVRLLVGGGRARKGRKTCTYVEPPGHCLLQLQIHELPCHWKPKITTPSMIGGCGGSEPLGESASLCPVLNVSYTLALRAYGSWGTWREEWVGTAADVESLTKYITQIG